MSYRDFIFKAQQAALIISDSGGIQEEAAHVGTQLLVPRSNTERPEGIETGWVQLVRAERAAILEAALEKLAAPSRHPLPIDDHPNWYERSVECKRWRFDRVAKFAGVVKSSSFVYAYEPYNEWLAPRR